MTLNLRYQAKDPSLPTAPLRTFAGSALALDLLVPQAIAGEPLAGVAVTIVNADGAPATAPAVCQTPGWWSVVFAGSVLPSYGYVTNGFRAVATLGTGEATHETILAVGDLDIRAASATAIPGDVAASLQTKGGDIYCKTTVVDGVQHYAKQTIAYDADMGAWGATWSGDYILVAGEWKEYKP